MKIKEKLTEKNCRLRTKDVEWIIVHYTATCASAENNYQAFMRPKCTDKSTHFIVDAKEVIHCIDEKHYFAWHCATTGKVTFCKARNWNSIGIDMCERKKDMTTCRVEDKDWYFDVSTLDNAARLISMLMHKYSITIDHVVRHYDVTHKWCPRPFVGDDNGGNKRWEEFKHKIMQYYSCTVA